jgi:unsaturated chondroitin disaccharide hydrolase
MHSVGSHPEGREIDVPLNYADYYFLEALLRYRSLVAARGAGR